MEPLLSLRTRKRQNRHQLPQIPAPTNHPEPNPELDPLLISNQILGSINAAARGPEEAPRPTRRFGTGVAATGTTAWVISGVNRLIQAIRPINPGKRRKKESRSYSRYVFLWRDVLIFSAGDFNRMGESKKRKKKRRERERKTGI